MTRTLTDLRAVLEGVVDEQRAAALAGVGQVPAGLDCAAEVRDWLIRVHAAMWCRLVGAGDVAGQLTDGSADLEVAWMAVTERREAAAKTAFRALDGNPAVWDRVGELTRVAHGPGLRYPDIHDLWDAVLPEDEGGMRQFLGEAAWSAAVCSVAEAAASGMVDEAGLVAAIDRQYAAVVAETQDALVALCVELGNSAGSGSAGT